MTELSKIDKSGVRCRMLEILHFISRQPHGYWPARWKVSRYDRNTFAALLSRGLLEEAPMESTTTYRLTEAGRELLAERMRPL